MPRLERQALRPLQSALEAPLMTATEEADAHAIDGDAPSSETLIVDWGNQFAMQTSHASGGG